MIVLDWLDQFVCGEVLHVAWPSYPYLFNCLGVDLKIAANWILKLDPVMVILQKSRAMGKALLNISKMYEAAI